MPRPPYFAKKDKKDAKMKGKGKKNRKAQLEAIK